MREDSRKAPKSAKIGVLGAPMRNFVFFVLFLAIYLVHPVHPCSIPDWRSRRNRGINPLLHFRKVSGLCPGGSGVAGDPPPGVAGRPSPEVYGVAGRNVPPPLTLVPAKPDLFANFAILARGLFSMRQGVSPGFSTWGHVKNQGADPFLRITIILQRLLPFL